jgi:hypothetical protein
MNAMKRVGSSSVMVALAVFAVFAVVLSAIPTADAATATDAGNEQPLRYWDLGLTLGAPENGTDHTQYWTASFDFDGNDGKWPYGDNAVMAVKFFFYSPDSQVSDRYSISSAGQMYSSDYVTVPVFVGTDGKPCVDDIICSPDLWPTDDDGNPLACYPVQAEAVLYTSVYNEDDDFDKK